MCIYIYVCTHTWEGEPRKVGDQEGEAKPLHVKACCVKTCCVHKLVCKSVCVKTAVHKDFCA